MKLRLPRALFRALVACFTALASTSLASASSAPGVSVSMRFAPPDVEQDGSLLCWAASAADILSLETGQDAAAIYRCITEASGNTAGYVESALSWYKEGAKGELAPQSFDGSHTITRSGFESLAALAENLQNALKESRAAALTLYARGDVESTGHAVTVYASAFESGRLYLSYADSADGVKGVRRAEVVESEHGFVLAGTNYAVGSITSIGEDGDADTASGAPVGAYLHSSPLYQEYSDLAENRGVYRFAYMPSVIMYQNGEDNYMVAITPDYSVVADQGCYTLVNYGSFQVTVEHNGVMGGGTFSSRFVGSENAQQYNCVGIRYNQTFVFGSENPYVPTGDDFKIERISRLVTDANSTAWCSDNNRLNNLNGVTYYRVGAGRSGYFDADGNVVSLASAWGYGLTAGIGTLDGGWFTEGTSVFHVGDTVSDFVYTSTTSPLPSATQSGDSGSPVFIYNEATGQFELISCLQGGSTYSWGTRYNGDAVSGAIAFLEVSVSTSTNYDASNADATTYYISGARVGVDDELISSDGAAAYLRKGTITLNGEVVAQYNGVSLDEFWEGTWKMLDADDLKWYTYTDYEYLNAAFATATDANTFGQDDLFYTSNIKLVADASADGSAAYRRVELTEDVDLGVGYVQYSLGEGVTEATFDLAKDSSEYHLSSAGFIIDEGVTVNNYITYEKGRELRRVGAGTMNIVGEGNSDVLLNLGGGGTTLLNRTNGYGAYSALVNTEAVLSLADAGQVYNNVTLGAGGGVLDFNGNDYRWTSGGARAEGSDGETYFGLTVYDGINRVEESYVVNYASGTLSTITIERSDDFEFAGAFRDGSSYSASSGQAWDSRYTMMPSLLIDSYYQFKASERVDSDSALKVVYNGGATMTMTGVYTVLTGSNSQGESGFEVASGSVVLRGTNTIHAIGSESGTNTNRLQVADDWHYAMAEMDVLVRDQATFELGDHSLLIGDITVETGGTFTMKQAVNQRYEYVEGWYVTEDTYALSDYYGLKGNVSLASGASMDIRFDEGISTLLTYGGNITGEGSLTVAVGTGTVTLTGSNTFSGEKTVESGNLYLASGAEGDVTTNKWLIQEQGSLALENVSSNADVLKYVDADSNGVLALTQNLAEQVTYSGLIVGAAEGATVHYGTADQALTAVDGSWTLGGGGGTLYVDFLLTGANTLVLGNEYGTGTVVLTNSLNTFTGGIDIVGDITLEYTDINALGAGGSLSLSYSNVLNALSNEIITSAKLSVDADGVYAVTDGMQDYDLSHYSSLALGANGTVTLTGSLTVADNAAYRFGGAGALTLDTALSGARDIVIDGQGNPGSSVTFAQASTTTGAVLIQGFDTAQGVTTGDVTVSFTVDNALASASSITLKNDSGMNLNGTNQSFTNLSIEQGSLIFDDKGGNTLTLNYSEGSYAYEGDMQLALTSIIKTGVGSVTLSGSNAWAGMDIQGGTVAVTSDASLGGNTSVQSGATLHITNWSEAAHEVVLDIAGTGADGMAGALVYDDYHANTKATINLTDDATISAANGLRVNTINLGGNELTINSDGGHFSVSSTIAGEGGSIIADNVHLRSLYGSNYNLTVQGGGSLNIDGYSGGATIGLTLNNANFNMGNGVIADDSSAGASTFNGTITIGSSGATISNSSGYDKDFNLAGMITGTGTLNLISGNGKTINLQGGMDLNATLALGWGVNVNVTKHAVANALTGYGSLTVTDSTLELDGTGTNYEGTLTLSGEGHLKLTGQSGSSLGTINTLAMGDSGVLTFANLSGYTSSAMLSVGSVTGSKKVEVDIASVSGLSSGTYQLLSGSSESFSDWTLTNAATNSRIGLALVAGGSEGAYTLSLQVTQGSLQTVIWTGTGTLTAGTSDSTHISSTAGDYQFLSFDHLVITSNSGDDHTLTLGETIYASSVTYTGAGTVSLADNTAAFAEGVGFTLDGTGRFEVDDTDFSAGSEWGTKAITGDVLLQQGTLAASTYSLNAMNSITVTGTAGIDLINPDSSDTGRVNNTIQIDEGAKLTLTTLSEWGGTMSGALAGKGDLIIENASSLTLLGDNSAFTGGMTVNSGTVYFGNSGYSDFAMGASSVTMNAGTTLVLSSTYAEYTGDYTWDRATLYVQEGSGDGPDPSSVGYLFSGNQILNGLLTYQTNWGKVTHFSGDISGEGSIDFTANYSWGGSPAVILSGDNTYSGGSTLGNSRLTLYAGSQQAFGTGVLNLNAGTLSWTGVGSGWDGDLSVSSIVLGGGAMSTYGQDVSLSAAISGDGALTKQGAGTLTLGGTLSYTGATTIEEGSLALNAQLASTAGVTVNKATILRVGGEYLNGNTVNLVSSLGGKVAQVIGTADALSSAGEYVISSGGNAMGVGYIGITEGGWFKTDISGESGALLIASPETTYMQGIISGDLSVSMAGNFMLMTANTYAGGTELTEGTLQIANASALGSGPLVAHDGSKVEVLVEATIAGDSYISDLVFSESGKVVVGTSSEAGSLMFSNYSGNASFALNIFGEDSYDYLIADLTDSTFSGTLDVTLAKNDIGTYELVQGSVGAVDAFTLNLNGKNENTYSYTWASTDSGLTLTIDYKSGTVNLWTGQNGDTWDATSTTAWNNSSYNDALAVTVMRVTGDTDITVATAVGSTTATDGTATTFRVETAKGATLTFTNSEDAAGSITSNTLQKEGDGTLTFNAGLTNSFNSVVINEGTVSIASANALGTTAISGEGTLEMTSGSMTAAVSTLTVENISLKGDASLTFNYDNAWAAEYRNFTIAEDAKLLTGHWCGVKNSNILLTEGGTLVVGSVGFTGNSIVVDGEGTLAIGQTTSTSDGANLDTDSTISGNGVLNITNYTANSSNGYTVAMSGVISDGDNGSLALNINQNSLSLSAASTYSGGTTISGGTVAVSNASALGTGSLTMNGGTLSMSSDLAIGSLSGTGGTISRGENALTITQTVDGSFAGTLSGSGSLTKLGDASLSLTDTGAVTVADLSLKAGSLSIAGAVTVTGTYAQAEGTTASFGALTLGVVELDMNQGSALSVTGALTLGSGSTLSYSSTTDYTNVGSIVVSGESSALTLNLTNDIFTYLVGVDANGTRNSYNLGADLSGVDTLSVTGLDSGTYSISTTDGLSYLTLKDSSSWVQNYRAVTWDANWGVLENAPASAWKLSLTATTALYGNSSVDNGTSVIASVANTGSSAIDVYALVNPSEWASGITYERDAWLEVTGGTFGVITAANFNNWQGGSSEAWNVLGDMHIMMTGGTADEVIGLTERQYTDTTFTGDSYVSIGSGATVLDSVVGGGVLRYTTPMTQVGNTHVVVNAVLSDNSSSLNGDGIGNRRNSVVGGHASGSGDATVLTLTGSTDVLINVAGQSGSFVKEIVGGHLSYKSEGIVTGDTNVSINGSDVTFTDDIIAGSVSYGGTETIGGNTTLTINGGTYSGGTSNFLTAGNWVTGGTSTIGGTATVILDGDAVINRHVFVAGYAGGGTSTVGATRLEIGSGVTIGNGIKLSGGFTSSANGTVTGNQTLALGDGVDLTTTTSTLERFNRIEVAEGTAKLDASKFVNLSEYTKTGDGTLQLTGTVANSASNVTKLTITGGMVELDSASNLNQSGNTSSTAITISAGTLSLDADFSIGTLTGGDKGVLDLGSNHSLTINQTSNGAFRGTLVGVTSLTKNGDAGLKMSNTEQDYNLTSLTVNGGDLILAGDVTLSGALTQADDTFVRLGSLTMTSVQTLAMGELTIDNDLTMVSGSTLSYTSVGEGTGAGGTFALTGGNALTLNVTADVLSDLSKGSGYYDALDLGVTLTDTMISNASVTGLESYSDLSYSFGTDASTGHTTLILADASYADVSWDDNWGTDELADAPTRLKATTVSAATAFYNSSYDDGSTIAVSITNNTSGSAVNLYATSSDGTSLTRDTWLEITGGTYGTIAGSSGASITGDMHVMVSGGTVEGDIIGYNATTVNGGPTHTGSSYITVGEGVSVTGSIVGAGISTNGSGGTLNGSTNIFVYEVQSAGTASTGTASNESTWSYNAIIGGFARTLGYGVEWTINGDTNVTLDLTDDSGTFSKNIYGGNVSERFSHIGTITGDTNVSIAAGNDVIFSSDIVAGSYKGGTESWRTDVIQGSSILTIDGGTYEDGGYLTAGSLVSGGTSTIGGTASVILNGGVINRDIYAAGISTGGTSTVGNSLVTINSGVTLGSGITVSGGFEGSGGTASVTGTRTLAFGDGVDLSGSTVSFADFDTVKVESGNAAVAASTLSSLSTVNKTGSGTLTLNGSTTQTVTLSEGTLAAASSGLTIGGLSADSSASTALALTGDMAVNQTGTVTYAGGLSGEGSFIMNGSGALILSASNLSAGVFKTTAGDLHLTGSLLTAGTLVVEGGTMSVNSITLTDSLSMSQSDLTVTTLTMAAGTTLEYSSATDYASITNFSAKGALTLSLTDDLVSSLQLNDGSYNSLNLGLTLTDTTNVSVAGFEANTYGFETDASTGYTLLKLYSDDMAAYYGVTWDKNWGVTGPEKAWHITLDSSTGFYGTEPYDDGATITASVIGTSGTINVFATVNQDDAWGEGASFSRNAWLEVADGTYGVIAGANINNWGAWWSPTTITGDIHLLVKGGSVDEVVGFSHKDAVTPKLVGSTYISVYDGSTINDSVIGGGVMRHGSGLTLDGSTNVYIYDVLDTNAATLNSEGIGTQHNAVIGGHAHGSGSRNAWSITGSTNVTIDLTDYSGESTNFVKTIYGGNVSNGQWGSIAGGTNVTLSAADSITFTENIVAGSYNYNSEGQVTIDADSTLTINGGTYANDADGTKFLTGGSLLDGSKSVLSGTASVILNGGIINRNVYAAGVNNDGTSTVGNSLVMINSGVTLGNAITVSGGFGGTTASGGTVSGTRTLAFGDGVNLASSTVSFTDFDSVQVASGNAAVAASTMDSLTAIVKTGAGTLTLNGSTGNTVTLSEGTLALGSDLALGGLSGEAGTAVTMGSYALTLNTSADAADYAGSVTGSGDITMAGSGSQTLSGSVQTTGNIKATAGSLTLSGDGVSAASLMAAGGVLTVSGNNLSVGTLEVTSGSLSLTGTGATAETLIVSGGSMEVGSITLTGTLAMNQSGLTVTALTMADNATLAYTSETGYATIDRVTGEGTLNLTLTENLMEYLTDRAADGSGFQTLDLGTALSATSTSVALEGLDSANYTYTIGTADNGNSTLQLTSSNYYVVAWDENWGENELATAPTGKTLSTQLLIDTQLSGSDYDDGSNIYASVKDTDSTLTLYATSKDGSSVTRDAWVEIAGGTFASIVGSSGGSITGDMHYMLSGGSVTGDVIGFNATDANGAPTHTGSSYISIGEGVSVTGNIVGAGISTSGNGGTLNGSTNIFVYEVLSGGTASTGTASNTSTWNYNAIIGGFARTLGYGVTWTIDGDTNVTLDLADDSGTFVKSIYGGNVSERFSHIGSITGDANVSIAASNDVIFIGNIVAGSYKGGDEWGRVDYIAGDSTLTIDGGTFEAGGYLTAGSLVVGGTTAIGGSLVSTGGWGDVSYTSEGGTASVILNGGIINRDVYAAGISNGGTSYVANSLVEINSSSVSFGAGVTVSGGFGGSGGTGTVTGTRTLSLADGANLSAATVKDFDLVSVESGTATVGAAELSDLTKQGSGTLVLGAGLAEGANLSLEAGKLAVGAALTLGNLSGAANTALNMGGYDLSITQSSEGSFAGELTNVGSLTKAGGAALTLSAVSLNGTLSMSNSTLSISSLTLADGATLAYSSMSDYTSIGSFAAGGALTLNVGEVDFSALAQTDGSYAAFNLGVALSSTDSVTVSGLADTLSYTFSSNADGMSTLVLTDTSYSAVSWDVAWNATNAPEKAWHHTLTETKGLYNTASYDNGTDIVLSVSGTQADSPLDLYATANLSGTWDSAVNLTRNAWVEVTGGTFGIIAGAHFNNWGNSASSIVGDLHFQMTGGSVNDIIGFSYMDAQGPSLTGNTFISVYEGASVNDSIIGGSELHHEAGATITGNTNIFIYGVLGANPAELSGTHTQNRYNAVIGGHAFGTNQWSDPMNIFGSTNITVDVADTLSGDFVKSIIGGHMMGTGDGLYGNVGTITQGTHVSLSAPAAVNFTADIAAGSRVVDSNKDTISGGTTLTISGGTYASGAVLTGGSYVTGGTSIINGAASVALNGGSINRDVYAAGYATGGSSTVEAASLTIGSGATLSSEADAVAGGYLADGTLTISGDSTLTVSGGTYDGGTGYFLIGGNWVEGGTSVIEGTAAVVLNGGTINRHVYAAGYSGGGTSTVGASRLEIASGVTIGDGIHLSGGFTTGANGSVTGDRTLALAGGVDLSAMGSTLESFDHFEVAAGTATLGTNTFTSITSYSKTGAGTLKLAGTASADATAVSIDGGTLQLESGYALASGGTVAAAVTLNNGTLQLDSATTISSTLSFAGEGDMRVTGATLTLSGGTDISYTGTGAAVVDATIQSTWANRLIFSVDSAGKGSDFVELSINGDITDASTSEYGVDKNGAGTLLLAGTNSFAWGFNINAGRVIAANTSALGTGSVDVAEGATLEIAKGTYVSLNHHINTAAGAELVVHELSADTAVLTTTGSAMAWWESSSIGTLTLTLAKDVTLETETDYKVISLGASSGGLASGVTTDDMGINNLTDKRYDFTLSFESDKTLYLTATEEDNISLVWNGAEGASVWNQNTANKNWKTADEAAAADYFANLDTVEFSDAASNKSVTVVDTGVKVASMTVSGSDYSFSGGSINLGEAYSVSQLTGAEATSGAVISNVKLTQNSISGIVGEGSLDYVMIDIAEGVNLKLENIILGQNAHITDEPATVDLSNVTVKLGSGNATALGAGQTISSGSSLVATGGSFTLDLVSDMSVYNVISNAFDTVGVSGTSLTLDLSGYSEWLGSLDGYNYIAISFGESADSLATFNTENLTISATLDGSTYNPVFVTDLASATTLYIPVSPDAAPEPTTTTLSLLALSMLAARRRRK